MTFLHIATTVCLGLLTGTEFAVSAFVNPILWQLEAPTQARVIQRFARNLGGVMPFWYVLSLLLLVVSSILERGEPSSALLFAGTGIWFAVIVLTLLFLVPINNRLARMEPEEWTTETRQEHRRWDTRHRFRIVALAAAWICFQLAIYR